MIKHNQDGAVSGVAISLILCIVLLVAALAFAGWAFAGRQDYKNNVDQKITAAQAVTKQQESSAKEKEFAEREKNPLRTYGGPEAYGSLVLKFPKTWSGLVDTSASNGQAAVDGYFYPNVVPSITSDSSTFALRVQVLQQAYADVLKDLSSLQDNPDKPVTMVPYALPKLPKVVGIKVDGNISDTKTGTMVVLPLRANTLELWTEGSDFENDFNNIILPNFTFSP